MDKPNELTIKEVEEDTDNLQEQLKHANEEIQSLTQQLSCLLVLTKKLNLIFRIVEHSLCLSLFVSLSSSAWRGDESAALHLACVIVFF